MLDKNPFIIDEFKGLHLGTADDIAPIECQDCIPFSYASQALNICFLKDGGIESRGPIVLLKLIPDPVFTVSFIAAPTEGGSIGERIIQFTSSIDVPGIEPYTYDWDFGDSSPHGTTENPIHTYVQGGGANPQVFPVTLVVTDSINTIATYFIGLEVTFNS